MSNEFKLVPVEPTEEMRNAYRKLGVSSWADRYAAMLAAAPQPPVLGGEPEVRDAFCAAYRTLRGYAPLRIEGTAEFQLWMAADELLRAPLQAEIDTHKQDAASWKAMCHVAMEGKDRLRSERDQIKARCDELHRMLGLAWGDGDVSAEDCRKIDTALSKPDGSEQVCGLCDGHGKLGMGLCPCGES